MKTKQSEKKETPITNRCPLCHKEDGLYLKKITDKVPYKKTCLMIKNVELFDCRHCGEEFYTAEQLRVHSRKINTAIRQHDHLLQAEEIARIRRKTGLSQQKLAVKLGLSLKSFAKWESNQDVQSIQMDNLLRAIDRDPTLVDYLSSFRMAA